MNPDCVRPLLLSRQRNGRQKLEFQIRLDGDQFYIDGFHDVGEFLPDGDVPEWDAWSFPLDGHELADYLARATLEESTTIRDGGRTCRFSPSGINLYTETPHSPLRSGIELSQSRRDSLYLDVASVLFAQESRPRTGLHVLSGSVEQTLLRRIREDPEILSLVSTDGFERVVVGTLQEVHGAPIHVERFRDDLNLWVITPGGATPSNSMLVSVEQRSTSISLGVIDRIADISSHRGLSRSVVVSRTEFSENAIECYRGRQSEIQLVDFLALKEVLQNGGWSQRGDHMLMCPTKSRPKNTIFVSYSSSDVAFARSIVRQLRLWGFSPFFDQLSLYGGDILLPALEDAIESSDAVIICVSRDSIDSRYVQAELHYALKRPELAIIPIDLEGCLVTQADAGALEEPFSKLAERVVVTVEGSSPEQLSDELAQQLYNAVSQAVADERV